MIILSIRSLVARSGPMLCGKAWARRYSKVLRIKKSQGNKYALRCPEPDCPFRIAWTKKVSGHLSMVDSKYRCLTHKEGCKNTPEPSEAPPPTSLSPLSAGVSGNSMSQTDRDRERERGGSQGSQGETTAQEEDHIDIHRRFLDEVARQKQKRLAEEANRIQEHASSSLQRKTLANVARLLNDTRRFPGFKDKLLALIKENDAFIAFQEMRMKQLMTGVVEAERGEVDKQRSGDPSPEREGESEGEGVGRGEVEGERSVADTPTDGEGATDPAGDAGQVIDIPESNDRETSPPHPLAPRPPFVPQVPVSTLRLGAVAGLSTGSATRRVVPIRLTGAGAVPVSGGSIYAEGVSSNPVVPLVPTVPAPVGRGPLMPVMPQPQTRCVPMRVVSRLSQTGHPSHSLVASRGGGDVPTSAVEDCVLPESSICTVDTVDTVSEQRLPTASVSADILPLESGAGREGVTTIPIVVSHAVPSDGLGERETEGESSSISPPDLPPGNVSPDSVTEPLLKRPAS
ncbi:hypothetical protein KIPB_002004 [Kipferlia bialata]|uniref:Uncharacterized protein n=1 Tax=Kipferlia bialata TaxID=797122 RepID=A0A9K3CPS9_9EUKA|nr:hypothetical protein KIPB_002004 [Kipferlia bialata]|eukprot:g2004.t1